MDEEDIDVYSEEYVPIAKSVGGLEPIHPDAVKATSRDDD